MKFYEIVVISSWVGDGLEASPYLSNINNDYPFLFHLENIVPIAGNHSLTSLLTVENGDTIIIKNSNGYATATFIIDVDGVRATQDMSAQQNIIPNPNNHSVMIICSEIVCDLIDADTNYYIESYEEIIDELEG